MHEVFVEGGLIRKLWSVEAADAYRDHLLRLDAESRRSRFGGAVADEMIRSYAATARGSDVVIHGFFVDGVLRGAADLRILGPLYRREAEVAFSIEKPWQSHGVGSVLLEQPAGGPQSRHQTSARQLSRRESAHAAACAQVRRRTDVRFRDGGRQDGKPASDAVVGDAGTGGRQPQLRRRLRRLSVTAAETRERFYRGVFGKGAQPDNQLSQRRPRAEYARARSALPFE